MPAYFLCHGGGPWPFMDGPFREGMRWLEASLKDLPRQLPAPPQAVVVVSAHWEDACFAVTTAERPGMVYDFQGFRPVLYEVRYPAPGAPALAARVLGLLSGAGLPVRGDAHRGYDHATYSLLKPIYPDADVPVVQVSLRLGLDPAEHLRAGQALAPLRDEGVLLVGSGMTVHERGPGMAGPSADFDRWLRHQLQQPDAQARDRALLQWEAAPHARTVHPHEDHLMPLLVAAGAAGNDAATCVYGERLMGLVTVSSWRFGGSVEPSRFDLGAHGVPHPMEST